MTVTGRSHSKLSAAALGRLEQLAKRYALPASAVRALRQLLALLVFDATAPTSIRDERAVLNDHLADSLVALELGEVRAAQRLADIGSGAGLPGLVLAAALPDADISLIESNGRKAAFLSHAAAVCGVANISVVGQRAELWRAGFERSGVVTARALAPLPVVAEYAAPLLAVGGTLVVWRGARDEEQEQAAKRAAAELGLVVRDPLQAQPYPQAQDRHLHLMLKVSPTPDRFPRRPGIAAKRPLGSER